jgi:hypothetical protein
MGPDAPSTGSFTGVVLRMGRTAPRLVQMALSADRSHPTRWRGMRISSPTTNRPPLARLAKAALVLEILLGIGALGGGLVLIVAPRGEVMPLPLSALAGSPFETYFWPGVILFTVLGLGPLVAARLVWARHWFAPLAAFVVGVALLIWVAVEVAIIGYSSQPPLQAIYLVLGAVITIVALGWLAEGGLPAVRRRAA